MTIVPTKVTRVCYHLLEELALRLPFWQYHELYRNAPYSFLLDSAKDSPGLGKYSFIGGDPFLVYCVKRAKRDGGGPPRWYPAEGGNEGRVQGSGFDSTELAEVRVQHLPPTTSLQPTAYSLQPIQKANIEVIELVDSNGRPLEEPVITRRTALPFDDLRQLLVEHSVEYQQYADHPVPFLSGVVGYFGYEAGYFIEELTDRGVDDLALPDIYLMLVSTVLAHCHSTGRSYLSILGRGENEKSASIQAENIYKTIFERIKEFESHAPPDKQISVAEHLSGMTMDIRGHFNQADYCRAIETVKEHIAAGDVYQVCLTRRLDASLVGGSAWDLYQQLRRINPAPFASFLNFPEVQVVSSSPERFLALGPDGMAESRPIKGTRPRGTTSEEDDRLRGELYESPKDRAENVMIVDLVRNDFGRVCAFRTVEVPEFLKIEDYATVFQMVSTIWGKLAKGRDALDLIRACFPGGSMTGAPKIEAMKIIDQLEPVKRGIYSGAIGYIDFAGAMDLSMVIRTILVHDGRCYFHVGGGIVADSHPIDEFQETQDKARALIQALINLRGIRD